MRVDRFHLTVSASIGEVSAETLVPVEPWAVLTLAHGAGAGMDHAFMRSLALELVDHGIVTLRFNFPMFRTWRIKPSLPPLSGHNSYFPPCRFLRVASRLAGE
ncbi:MAG: alpha/beta family hydrolase [Flammeovirgaceae bacterium]